MNHTEEQFQTLEKTIKKESNILIAIVHPSVYGPLRGLNFLLKSPDAKVTESYFLSGCEGISTYVWEKTGMAVRPMLMPNEMISLLETPPVEVDTIEDGEKHIKNVLDKHTLGDDPFYFRLGIL